MQCIRRKIVMESGFNGGINMNRKQLLEELMKRYSFEKAHSFVQIVTEDRIFENEDVKITMTRTLEADLYTLEWQ